MTDDTTTRATKDNQSTTDEKVMKLAVDFMKSSTGLHDAHLSLFNSGLEAFVAENPDKGINAFVVTDRGGELRELVAKSREVLMKGPIEAFTKALDDEFAAIEAEMNKAIEQFSLAHNVDGRQARKRLEEISPTFATITKRQAAIPAEKREAVKRSTVFADRWRAAELQKSQRAEQERLAERSKRRMSPVEKKLDDRIEEIMKTRKLEKPAATTWAMQHDDVAKSLYEVFREQRANGARA